jgi:hypothetical protein
MSKKSKARKFLLFGLTPLAVVLVVLVPVIALGLTSGPVPDSTNGQQATIQQYINSYINKQFSSTDEGEAGFYVDQAALKTRLDSNGDGTILGEGDDMANAPVMVDNLDMIPTIIPGTEFRCVWNVDCFSASSVNDVKQLVDSHKAAGFSTDVVDYCMTDHTAAPTTAGWGIIAQTGALASDGSIPNVYNFKWGRDGWTDTFTDSPQPTNTNPTKAADPATTSAAATPPADSCNASANNQELVRCSAAWAIGKTAGNVGNGVMPGGTSPNQTLNATQIVDVRSDTPAATVDNAHYNAASKTIQVPLQTLFNTGLTSVDPAQTTLIASRSQAAGGLAAMGLKMLGYNMSTGGYIHSGVSTWNDTMPGMQVKTGHVYKLDPIAAFTNPGFVNTTPPVISNVNTAPSNTSAKITWTTDQPDTSIVEYSTTPGGPYTKVTTGCDSGGTPENCTVLRANHSVTITGLSASTTYYYKVTSYDRYANSASTSEASFNTAIPRGNTDYVYYFPWYDTSNDGFGAGTWVNIANDGASTATVSIRLGGRLKTEFTLAAGAETNKIWSNEKEGPVEVRCEGCTTSGNHLTVAERALYNGTFNETIAPEHTEGGGASDLGTKYSFPWYDNMSSHNMNGDWILATNADPTNSATVDVYVGDALKQTLGPIAPHATNADQLQISPQMAGGPIRVVSRGGQPIVVSQRVLYGNSFNETFGRKLP